MANSNLKVFIVESDFYARLALSSYLAWDRRTRVTDKFSDLLDLVATLRATSRAEMPDTILLDDALIPTVESAGTALEEIHQYCDAHVLVMAHKPSNAIAQVVRRAGSKGYVDREDVGLQVSWMVVWGREHEFIVTPRTASIFPDAAILPDGREYPELTDRIRQALMLCVIEGMSAELAADEMGLSPHTIRTYVKEGYSILESYDKTTYSSSLSPQEKAFMRLTALQLDTLSEKLSRRNL